ncbi:MAG: hypothetical protein O7H41_01575 [Planctomycetota bacterium]|nr:hypothetical protein [Planctomycetota bacterium]
MLNIRLSVLVTIIAVAFTLGLAGATALQEGEGPGKDGKGDDSGGMALPAPVADPELGKLVGSWEWDGEIMHPQTRAWTPLKGKEEWKWGLNGQFLLLEVEVADAFGPGKPMVGLWVVRPAGDGKYKAWWFDVLGTVEVSDGELKDGKITFIGTSRWGKSRASFTISDDGTYESNSDMLGPDGKWIPHMKAKARKVE